VVDWRLILRGIFRKSDGGINCIDLAQGKDRWRLFVNEAMDFRVPYNAGNCMTS